MIVYHGTSAKRARQICDRGFLPRKPSKRVWFAQARAYAEGRARTQARRSHDRPVVLTCEIDLQVFRRRYGSKRILHRNSVIAISGPVPVSVLLSYPSTVDVPASPEEMARWVNDLLGLKPYKGPGPKHPGIQRLSKWVINRLQSRPDSRFRQAELLEMARQWLPGFFQDVVIDPERLRAYRRHEEIEVRAEEPQTPSDPREEQALECLEDDRPARRVRGLRLLAKIKDPDLSDWCLMFLDDESDRVRVAALRAMRQCDDGDAETLAPLAEAHSKRVRAAALAALAKFGGADAPAWFDRGLRDPEPAVRLETASVLDSLDPTEHRAIFELALNDPNPQVAETARKLAAGKGFHQARR